MINENEITFILWKWTGWRGDIYRSENVNAFCRMLSANVDLPHRIICITDDPAGITECNTYPLWDEWPDLGSVGRPNCFRRLKLFQKSFAETLGTRLVSIDLDCVILQNITHMFQTASPFKITQGRSARYNGSMWMLTPGVHEHVWNDFHPVNSPNEIKAVHRQRKRYGQGKLVGSDQAWMSIKIDNADTWSVGAGPNDEIASYMLDIHKSRTIPSHTKIVFFAGRTKPWDEACKYDCPQLYTAYQKYS